MRPAGGGQGPDRSGGEGPGGEGGHHHKPWSMTYFINTGYSNHQKGFAVDVSLVKVFRTETRSTGGRSYLVPVDYQEYEMPTPIHELSMAAASTTGPGETTLASTMNDPAIALRDYFRKAGMTPLESEWWHFNDYAARTLAGGRTSTGGFEVTRCRSAAPDEKYERQDVSSCLFIYLVSVLHAGAAAAAAQPPACTAAVGTALGGIHSHNGDGLALAGASAIGAGHHSAAAADGAALLGQAVDIHLTHGRGRIGGIGIELMVRRLFPSPSITYISAY